MRCDLNRISPSFFSFSVLKKARHIQWTTQWFWVGFAQTPCASRVPPFTLLSLVSIGTNASLPVISMSLYPVSLWLSDCPLCHTCSLQVLSSPNNWLLKYACRWESSAQRGSRMNVRTNGQMHAILQDISLFTSLPIRNQSFCSISLECTFHSRLKGWLLDVWR